MNLKQEVLSDTHLAIEKLEAAQKLIRKICEQGEFGHDYENELSEISQSLEFLAGKAKVRLASLSFPAG
jgi:hypothetical protein